MERADWLRKFGGLPKPVKKDKVLRCRSVHLCATGCCADAACRSRCMKDERSTRGLPAHYSAPTRRAACDTARALCVSLPLMKVEYIWNQWLKMSRNMSVRNTMYDRGYSMPSTASSPAVASRSVTMSSTFEHGDQGYERYIQGRCQGWGSS